MFIQGVFIGKDNHSKLLVEVKGDRSETWLQQKIAAHVDFLRTLQSAPNYHKHRIHYTFHTARTELHDNNSS